MPQLAADKGLRLWVAVIPMEDVASASSYVLTTDIAGPEGLDAAKATAKEKTLFQSAKKAGGL
jgi:hypothetical protein